MIAGTVGELAMQLRKVYWEALGDTERAQAEPEPASIDAWVEVAHEVTRQAGDLAREVLRGTIRE